MIKYPKTPRTGTIEYPKEWGSMNVVVSEKLDGANSGISFDSTGNLLLQSRGHILRGGEKEKQFSLFKQIFQSNRNNLYSVIKDKYLIFGEWLYAKHKIFYDALPGYFVAYDLFDKENQYFLATDLRQEILHQLNLPEAPILHRGAIWKSK